MTTSPRGAKITAVAIPGAYVFEKVELAIAEVWVGNRKLDDVVMDVPIPLDQQELCSYGDFTMYFDVVWEVVDSRTLRMALRGPAAHRKKPPEKKRAMRLRKRKWTLTFGDIT